MLYNIIKCDIVILQKGKKGMKFEEYLEKRTNVDKYILKELKDDVSDDFVYKLTLKNRYDDASDSTSTEIYKKYSNVERRMQMDREFCEVTNFDELDINEYIWWNVEKYVLTDGEYKKYISCSLSSDGSLIHFFVYPGYLEAFLKDKNIIDVLNCRNVDAPYKTGDILKVHQKPVGEDFYIIYCYDETKAGNNHLQMTFEDEIGFCELNWLHKTEKVEISPVEKINEMSKKIKENPSVLRELIVKCGISDF